MDLHLLASDFFNMSNANYSQEGEHGGASMRVTGAGWSSSGPCASAADASDARGLPPSPLRPSFPSQLIAGAGRVFLRGARKWTEAAAARWWRGPGPWRAPRREARRRGEEAGEVRSGGIGGEGFVFLPLLWRRGPEASTARRPAGWLVVWFFHVPAASEVPIPCSAASPSPRIACRASLPSPLLGDSR